MKRVTSVLICLLILAFTSPVDAQEEGKRKKKKNQEETTEVAPVPEPKKEKESNFKEIDEVTKACRQKGGLFTLYQDTITGTTFIEITEDQIGREFIYFKQVLDGVSDARYNRGSYRDNKILKIDRHFDRIELRQQNTKFYFDPENALTNSGNANINEPIVLSEKIEAMSRDTGEDATTRYLIASDAMFLSETINQVKPSNPPGASASKLFNLGKLSKTKTKYKSINNYPENTDVIVEYAFENLHPTVGGSEAITNPRYVTLTVQHSLIAMPENDYRPRYDDARVGYFLNKVTDLTSKSATPYRDVIKRWYLQKKDPEAEISEPVEPITWWIENTTPHEIRDIIKEAGLKWNEAFEKAGFKNALVINVQPDTAEWDAGDIRYNVIRWTSSPTPAFGGYGPSFANPRTGQILAADIMMEYIILAGRMRMEKVFDRAGMAEDQELSELDADLDPFICSDGSYAHQEQLFAMLAADAIGLDEEDKHQLTEQYLGRVVMHELGHTLGLMHNFIASQSTGLDEVNDMKLGADIGISSSVMDYHATNLALNKEDQGYYYISKPGVYDQWAIEYGYREFEDEASEEAGLAKILSRSTDPALYFGNDADDMRSPGKGMDPHINVSDLTSDAIGFSINRIELVKQSFPTLMENMLEEGRSYNELRSGYLMLTGNYSGALNIVSRFIGGVHIDRARVGQVTENDPLTPVSYTEQKRAMSVLSKYAFAPDAFSYDEEILSHLKMQRRGWDHRRSSEDPKVHSRVLTMQKNILNHVLHPNVLTRLTDSELYGNKYSVAEMMGDLTSAIIDSDLYTSVNTFRQQLQMEYVVRLGKAMNSSVNIYPTRSAALYQLNNIKSKYSKAKSPDESTKAHRQHVLFTIDKILDTDN